MIMKLIKLVSKALVAGTMLASGIASATELTLPGANEMSVGVYNDFNVYSLDLLEKCAADPRCQPQDGLPVQSSPGQAGLASQAVIVQATGGQDNFPPFSAGDAIDDPFESPDGNQGDTFDMNTSVPLNARYTFSLEMLDGKLRVTINGKEVYTRTPSAGILDNKFYFKAGNYDQSAVAGTPDKTPYSIVATYSVTVEHD